MAKGLRDEETSCEGGDGEREGEQHAAQVQVQHLTDKRRLRVDRRSRYLITDKSGIGVGTRQKSFWWTLIQVGLVQTRQYVLLCYTT
jgi:hypothetical protein